MVLKKHLLATCFLAMLFSGILSAQPDTIWNRANLAEVVLNVADAQKTAAWYRVHLGFMTDSLATSDNRIGLHRDSFSLVLQEPENYLAFDSVPKGPFIQYIEGFFKYGFLVEGFDHLVAQLRTAGVEFRGDVVYDKNLKLRSLILVDPAGNRVQLFGDRATRYHEEIRFRPYFFSIITNDLENSLEWYRSYLGMKEVYNLDMPDRNVFVRIMQSPELLLELIAIPDKVLRRKNLSDPAALQGMIRIGITPHPGDRDEMFSILEGFGQLNSNGPNPEGWYAAEDASGNPVWFR